MSVCTTHAARPRRRLDSLAARSHERGRDAVAIGRVVNAHPRMVVMRTAIVFSLATAAAFADAPKRPNIIFIFTDDHAQHALSCYGSKVNQTPHLDRLVSGGARFTNAFVTKHICTPSRATLLTGQYSHTNGVQVFNRFDGGCDHLAKRLEAGGYHTGMIGTWHLGSDPTGFDRWIVPPGLGLLPRPHVSRARRIAHGRRALHGGDHRPRPRVPEDPAGE